MAEPGPASMRRKDTRRRQATTGQTREAAVAKIRELHAQFARYALPIEELRKLLDKELGDKTLTDELYAMREGR